MHRDTRGARNGRRYVGEEVVAGRQGHAKNIAPSFHLSSALAYI